MADVIDVNMSVNKSSQSTSQSVNNSESIYLSIQEIASRAGVHPNTVRNKVLDSEPDESKIQLDGTKKIIDLHYAAQKLGVDVNKLLPKNHDNVNKSDVNKEVDESSQIVNKEVTRAYQDTIQNLKDQIELLRGQLAIKDEQISKLMDELSDSRNQSNIILKNIQDQFLPIIDNQQKLLESKEEEEKRRKKGWWPFNS